MTVVCQADDDMAKRIEANLYKLVNVLRVDDITRKDSIAHNLMLIKVAADQAAQVTIQQAIETKTSAHRRPNCGIGDR